MTTNNQPPTKLVEIVYKYLRGDLTRREFEALCRKYKTSASALLRLVERLQRD